MAITVNPKSSLATCSVAFPVRRRNLFACRFSLQLVLVVAVLAMATSPGFCTITATASSTSVGSAADTVDGQGVGQNNYWQSGSSYPATLTIDLGSEQTIDEVTIELPITNWGPRTQTYSISGSTDGNTFTPLILSACYSFDASINNNAV